ncbi:MAG: potassium-transporting ATPase subunit KdpC [Acidaminococcaceae bacterium]
MQLIKELLLKATGLVAVLTLLCGVLYPLVVTGLSQSCFPEKANGSIIEVAGQTYGSALLGQQFQAEDYLWGRPMKVDATTFKNAAGQPVMYAVPFNLSPAGAEFEQLVQARVQQLRTANPQGTGVSVPVDLVTGSGSGLDPQISVAAAEYQVPRLAKAHHCEPAVIRQILREATTPRLLGVVGEPVVNVLQVNLRLAQLL